MATNARAYDVVILGATGFTGKLCSMHLAHKIRAQPELKANRFGLVGRSEAKLQKIKDDMEGIDGRCADVGLLVADTLNKESLTSVVQKAKVVLTFVGPYLKYGFLVAQSCVESGTDYCDITGESAYQKKMIEELHEKAKSKGVSLVTGVGYDSIPFDIGTYVLVKHLRSKSNTGSISVQACLGSAKGGVSGGTIASIASQEPLHSHVLDPVFDKSTYPKVESPYGIGQYHEPSKTWLAPSIMESINKKVVYRSRGLMEQTYGKDFCYQEFTSRPGRFGSYFMTFFMAFGGLLVSKNSVRNFLINRGVLPKPGEGPSKELQETGFFNAFVYGKVSENAGSSHEALVHVKGEKGDPGYKLTSAMALEAAMCLANKDKLNMNMLGGVLTPASCMGDVLVEHLPKVNVTFTLEEDPSSVAMFPSKL